SGRRLRSIPFTMTVPASGLSSEPTICRSVLFPAPDAPTILTISFLCTSRSTPLSIRRLPYDFSIPRAVRIICLLPEYKKIVHPNKPPAGKPFSKPGTDIFSVFPSPAIEDVKEARVRNIGLGLVTLCCLAEELCVIGLQHLQLTLPEIAYIHYDIRGD